MQILVVGAGIGGLTAALALRQSGFDVHVYEQAGVLARGRCRGGDQSQCLSRATSPRARGCPRRCWRPLGLTRFARLAHWCPSGPCAPWRGGSHSLGRPLLPPAPRRSARRAARRPRRRADHPRRPLRRPQAGRDHRDGPLCRRTGGEWRPADRRRRHPLGRARARGGSRPAAVFWAGIVEGPSTRGRWAQGEAGGAPPLLLGTAPAIRLLLCERWAADKLGGQH